MQFNTFAVTIFANKAKTRKFYECTVIDILFYDCNVNIKEAIVLCPDVSVVHASGSGQLQANPHVAGPWLSPGKPTRRVVTMIGLNDLVIGEDHMLGPSFQLYNRQTGR